MRRKRNNRTDGQPNPGTPGAGGAKAQAQPVEVLPHLGFALTTHRSLVLLALVSLLLQTLSFEPIGFWPAVFVCLVPWCVLIGTAHSAPRVYFYSYLLGLAFFLLNLRWALHATTVRFAHAWLLLGLYLGLYYLLVACPVRHAIRRRRMPLAVVVPLVWTGSEILRAVVITGFPWFFLSHSLYRVLPLTQISDLVGAYGVSFVAAAVNGMLADVVIAFVASRKAAAPGVNIRRARFSIVFAAALLVVSLIYGLVQLRTGTLSPGPRIATVQGDHLTTIDGDEGTPTEKRNLYFTIMEDAALRQPDLYLLPESPWPMLLNPESREFSRGSQESFRRFQQFAREQNAYIVTGGYTKIPTPHDVLAKQRVYNSAYIFSPDGAEPARYDKRHLVLFGETLPFRFGRLRFLYLWLNSLTPFSGEDGAEEWSTFPGERFRTFSLAAPSQGGKVYRFGIPICYEDVMPYISREFVSGPDGAKQVDLLLNISNDGWFGRGHQQPQHLSTCVFRAVENRVPIVRSVNTGISAFIDSFGRVHDVVQGAATANWPGQCGYTVATVQVDSRYSFYSRYGDWFAWACALCGLLLYVDYSIVRARTREPQS
ncbi:MAG TPA: apolipoprotein N-acyltransferase [Phycisphaerae bacterium]|nr:apolipoprotein N-acyltransferase [Phycisphaerae bacterium]HNU44971.1 apolipoprotein N-acyltransferase [Phycisphaerae bacterium]